MIKPTNELQNESENKVIIEFAKLLNIAPMEIIARINNQKISDIRHLYCKLRCENHGASYARIGREIGRHHATVIYAIKRINDLLSLNDKKIVEMWNKVKGDRKSVV